jgi:very-short-patch-repair endonuclease
MRRKVSSRRVTLDECAEFGERLGSEGAIEAVTVRQHAMINGRQLRAVGLHPSAIDRRVRRGVLRPMLRGVYLAGPVVPPLGEEMAAVLACDQLAWISHASAAFLHRLPPYPAKPRPVQLTVTGSAIRRPGLRVHRVSRLDADEITEVEGIPVTTATRAILDLAGSAPAVLERAISEGFAKRVTSRDRLLELCRRYAHARGVARLRGLLDEGLRVTRSGPERTLLRLLQRARISLPQTNVRIGKWEVDFLWPEAKLIVEVDALSTHTSPFHFERDRRKDAELTLRGYMVLRVTARQLRESPDSVIARIVAALDLCDRRRIAP